MPQNNATLMTEEERARVVQWARGGGEDPPPQGEVAP